MLDILFIVLGVGGVMLMAAYAWGLRAHLMLDLILGGVVSFGLLIYLLVALIRPEDL